jgi:hypothetical protein
MLCEKLGKFPDEFKNCSEPELAFLITAVQEIYGEKKDGR